VSSPERDAQPRAERSHAGHAYAGIGSRETPSGVLELMRALAARLARAGWTLRSGASPGADQAFYRGARGEGGKVELYLPWPGFQEASWQGEGSAEVRVCERPSAHAYELAATLAPGWERLGEHARLLLARDSHQVLGADLATPARFVVCWTADGSLDGRGADGDGTHQALRIAHREGVPVFNLARADHLRRLTDAQPNGCVL
jgi:hypothetical protein